MDPSAGEELAEAMYLAEVNGLNLQCVHSKLIQAGGDNGDGSAVIMMMLTLQLERKAVRPRGILMNKLDARRDSDSSQSPINVDRLMRANGSKP